MSIFRSVPQIAVKIDNASIEAEIIQTVYNIRVRQVVSAPSQCEISVNGANQEFVDQVIDKIGSNLQVLIIEQKKPLFTGQITAVEFFYDATLGPSVMIRSYDLLHRLQKQQTVRTLVQVNMNKLASELVSNLGLNVHGGENTPTVAKLFQYEQSDLELLQQFGEKFGAFFFLNGKDLHITSLNGDSSFTLLKLGQNLLDAKFTVNANTVMKSVTATGWNHYRTTPHFGTAKASAVTCQNKPALDTSKFIDNDHYTYVDCAIADDIQAEQYAQKEIDYRYQQQIILTGTAEGNIELRPGIRIRLEGVHDSLQGNYSLTEVTHILDPNTGYIAKINTSIPRLKSNNLKHNATIGIVTQVDDPEQMGRVKVTLPTYNDVETDWLEVLAAGAGNQKGQLILPDIGDHVLLLLINGEPTQAIVLGGLYGENDLPHAPVEDSMTKRFITRTAGNQKIYLDDQDTSILIETDHGHHIRLTPDAIDIARDKGSYISLSNKRMTIHSGTDLEISAPGSSITIRGKRIDFEEA